MCTISKVCLVPISFSIDSHNLIELINARVLLVIRTANSIYSDGYILNFVFTFYREVYVKEKL